MLTTQIFGALAGAVFVITCSVVGGRLLWLAWKTRELPELCIGAGLLSVVGLGFPLIVASGMGPRAVVELSLPLLAIGLGFVALGTVCLYAFTWRVFRPRNPWAKRIVVGAALGLVVVVVGSVRAFTLARPEQLSMDTGLDWLVWTRVAILGAYLWTGIESYNHYRMARRRLSLGLAEPVVTNRLLLWSLTGGIEVAINAVDLVLQLRGVNLMVDPRAMAVTAIGGVMASAMMYLTFLPPKAYLGWVRGRYAHGTT